MKKLTRLAVVVGLTLSFGLVAFGGETQAPPCSNDPGETQAPPCSSAQYTSDSDGAETLQTSDSTSYATTETTIALVQSVLSLL